MPELLRRIRPLLLLLSAWPVSASAQSLSVTSRSVYHAYEIQLDPGRDGGPTRNLNRFYQSLEAGGWSLIPGQNISAVLSFRYDTDFGTGYNPDTPDGVGIPAVGDRNDLDLLYFYVDWKGLGTEHLDVRLGRQVLMDDLDWYSLDGVKLTLHVLEPGEDALDASIYVGLPVRYELLFSSEAFINDGTQVDDANGAIGGLALGGNVLFRKWGLSISGAYRQELSFREAELEVFGIDPEAAARSEGTFALQESLLGFSASYDLKPAALNVYGHLVWNLLVSDLDQARAGLGWNPWMGFHFGAEYLRSRPRFVGDSIFNWFNIFPYDRGRFELSWDVLEWLSISGGYYLQQFNGGPVGTSDNEFAGSSFNHGPSGGVTLSYAGIRGGLYAEGASNANSDYGYGGNYRYGHLFVDADLLDGLIGGLVRFSLTTFQNDWFERVDEGVVADPETSFALNVGLRTRPVQWVSVRANFIKNFSSAFEGSYRIYSELALHY